MREVYLQITKVQNLKPETVNYYDYYWQCYSNHIALNQIISRHSYFMS